MEPIRLDPQNVSINSLGRPDVQSGSTQTAIPVAQKAIQGESIFTGSANSIRGVEQKHPLITRAALLIVNEIALKIGSIFGLAASFFFFKEYARQDERAKSASEVKAPASRVASTVKSIRDWENKGTAHKIASRTVLGTLGLIALYGLPFVGQLIVYPFFSEFVAQAEREKMNQETTTPVKTIQEVIIPEVINLPKHPVMPIEPPVQHPVLRHPVVHPAPQPAVEQPVQQPVVAQPVIAPQPAAVEQPVQQPVQAEAAPAAVEQPVQQPVVQAEAAPQPAAELPVQQPVVAQPEVAPQPAAVEQPVQQPVVAQPEVAPQPAAVEQPVQQPVVAQPEAAPQPEQPIIVNAMMLPPEPVMPTSSQIEIFTAPEAEMIARIKAPEATIIDDEDDVQTSVSDSDVPAAPALDSSVLTVEQNPAKRFIVGAPPAMTARAPVMPLEFQMPKMRHVEAPASKVQSSSQLIQQMRRGSQSMIQATIGKYVVQDHRDAEVIADTEWALPTATTSSSIADEAPVAAPKFAKTYDKKSVDGRSSTVVQMTGDQLALLAPLMKRRRSSMKG